MFGILNIFLIYVKILKLVVISVVYYESTVEKHYKRT